MFKVKKFSHFCQYERNLNVSEVKISLLQVWELFTCKAPQKSELTLSFKYT